MEKLLPQNIEAEAGVLGSIIIDPEAIVELADFLVPSDFYRDAHRVIYEVIITLYNQHAPADFITLCDELDRRGKLEACGGASYITSLIDQVPTSSNVEFYGRIVERTSILRRLIHAAGQIAAIAYEESDADVALEKAHTLIGEVSRVEGRTEALTLSAYWPHYLERLDRLHAGDAEAMRGIPTGYPQLDALIGRLQQGALYIPAARPSVGKTTLCQNIAYNAAVKYGKRCVFYSLEMSFDDLMDRFVSMHTRIDSLKLRGGLEDADWDKVTDMGEEAALEHIAIEYVPGITLAELVKKAQRLMARAPFDLMIVDYLQLMQATVNGKRIIHRELEIAEIARGLKKLAGELGVPILAPAQINRETEARIAVEDKATGLSYKLPHLSDLRECVVSSTRLIDARTGQWKPIIQIKPGDEILGVGEHQKIGRFAVEKVWMTGKKPVYRLTTRTGKQLIATDNHPLLTATGWKPLGELRIGEQIATAMRLPEYGLEMPERVDLCRLLGYMVGDGTYQNHRGIGFISSDPETFEDAINIVATHFPEISTHPHQCQGKAQEVYFTGIHTNGYGKPYGNPLREWLRSLGILGQQDNTKYVPPWVFEAGKVGAQAFLAGYLSSDGCVKRGVKNGRVIWEIHFDTVSHQLANDIQSLLLRIGVVASIDNGRQGTKATQLIYRISVSSISENLICFAEQVTARGKKGRLLQQLLGERPVTQTGPGVFGLPPELSTYVALRAKWRDQGKCMRRNTCLEWAEHLDDPFLREWGESDLLWEEVRSIEPFGESAEVYDICVPGCKNFIADGIIAHNSGELEQSADVVMLLARSEQRDELVKLLVAKHRNGPRGNLDLYFEGTSTRFYPVDERIVEGSLIR